MTRVLITGMSGTGKSTVLSALAARGYAVVDTDYDGWKQWVTVDSERDWVWREDRMARLLAEHTGPPLFVAGTSSNQGRFYDRFEHVVLLSAPTPLIVERLAGRSNNPYGKGPGELARILGHIETVEPLLRRRATLEVDTSVPVDAVVAAILAHIGA